MNKYLSEFLGTFLLVFVGCGAIMIDYLTGGKITFIGVGAAFGLAIMIAIIIFGPHSGAHINPAVSLAMWIRGRLSIRDMFLYWLSQIAAAVAAALMLGLLLRVSADKIINFPATGIARSAVFEIAFTFVLVMTVLVIPRFKKLSQYGPALVGLTVISMAIIAGPVTGASVNPARSIGPALINGQLDHLWIYTAAPLLGAFLATLVFSLFKES